MLRKFPQCCFWVGFLRTGFKKHTDGVVPLCFLPLLFLFSKGIRNQSPPSNRVLNPSSGRRLALSFCFWLKLKPVTNNAELQGWCRRFSQTWVMGTWPTEPALRKPLWYFLDLFCSFLLIVPFYYVLAAWRFLKVYPVCKKHWQKIILFCISNSSYCVVFEICSHQSPQTPIAMAGKGHC